MACAMWFERHRVVAGDEHLMTLLSDGCFVQDGNLLLQRVQNLPRSRHEVRQKRRTGLLVVVC